MSLELDPFVNLPAAAGDATMAASLMEPHDTHLIEQVILQIADAFDFRVVLDHAGAALVGAGVAAGAALAAGGAGAVLVTAAGVGAVVGVAIGGVISLRAAWHLIRDQLQELPFIVMNWLRRFDAVDITRACELLMASTVSRRELALTLLHFITDVLGRHLISSLMA